MQPADMANTILVVDDEPLVADVLASALGEGLGPAICAMTIEHAKELLEANRFRLAVVDVVMRRSGVELGSIAVGLGTPVMLISGDFEAVAALRCYGFPFVLLKPVRTGRLVQEAQLAIVQREELCRAYRLAEDVRALHVDAIRRC